MINCVFRFSDLETFVAKMAEIGVDTRPAVDENDNAVAIEQRVGKTMTCLLDHLVTGAFAASCHITAEQAALIPDVTSPEFLCDWRSDETDEEGNLLPWPEYEINVYDDEGNITGTRMQGVGRIG